MSIITTVRRFFARNERKEIVVPDGPRLTMTQTRQHLLHELANLKIDHDRLTFILEQPMCLMPVRYKSEHYRYTWSIYGTQDAHRHLAINEELTYERRRELNALDPHPDFDRMYPNPTTRQLSAA